MKTHRISPKFLRSLMIPVMVFFIISSFKEGEEQKKEQPNLLFIFPDQYRAQAVGFTGEDPVVTPNLDHLAEQSKVLVHAVSTRPLSSPFRGMLMTGQYPHENGILTNCNTSTRRYRNYLKKEQTIISDVLSNNGYFCGYIGKWHLDAPKGPDVDDWRKSKWDHYVPPEKHHGFDFWHAYGCHNLHMSPHYWENDAPREDTLFVDKWSPIHEADVAIDFIKGNKRQNGKPWALFVSMNPPHGPFSKYPDRYKEFYEDMPMDSLLYRANVPDDPDQIRRARNSVRNYFSMVTGVDQQVGRILDALKEQGLAENTIVVFTADHGEMMGSQGLMHKNWWYEESFRVPFMIRWPGQIEPGKDPLHMDTPDLMPSLLGLMGLNQHIPADVQGRNFAPAFLGQEQDTPEFSLYINSSFGSALGGRRGLRTNRYTFVMIRNNEGEVENYYLHDNRKDPYQLENIAESHPELVEQFENKLYQRLKEINDPWIRWAPVSWLEEHDLR